MPSNLDGRPQTTAVHHHLHASISDARALLPRHALKFACHGLMAYRMLEVHASQLTRPSTASDVRIPIARV
jgi:hypothetical protein